MAKKRVHQIAKEKGISSKEVISVLQKAGLDVKTAAQSVDEGDIARAFSNGDASAAGNGAETARPTAGDADGGKAAAKARSAAAAAAEAGDGQEPPAGDGQPTAADGAPEADAEAGAPEGGQQQRPQRPQRAAPPRDSGGGAGRRRRVVIDSQASRRPSGPPPPQQAPRRGRGRRRRTPWVEPDLNAPAPVVEEAPPVPIPSGATVKEVAESLGLSSAEVIKKLM